MPCDRYTRAVNSKNRPQELAFVVRAKLDAKELGGELRRLRSAAGISLGDMAERTGIAYQNLSRMELGKREPMLSTVNHYLRVLGFELVISTRPKKSAGDEE